MATILKRPGKCGSMSFLIRVSLGYDSQNRQIIKSKTFKPDKSLTEKQALKAANKEAILFEEECKAFGLNNRRVKFQILADEWLELMERTQEVKPATIVRFKTLKKRTYDAIGNIYVDKLTYKQIQNFILTLSGDGVNQKTGKGLSQKSQKQYLSFISNVMKYALKCGLISLNPCKDIATVKSETKEKQIYSLDEVKYILSEIDEKASTDYKVFFNLLAYCGLRRGEALGIEYKDIDFKTGMLFINRTSNYNSEKGVYTGTPKTKSSCRCLYLQPNILNMIKQLKREQEETAAMLGDLWVESDRLFITWYGSPMHPNTPYNWLKRFCGSEGIEFSLSKKSSKSWAFLRKYGIIEAVMKVIVKGRENRDQLEIFSIEGFVPADHLLRKIDSAVDFSHIYDIVEDLYCADNGRPSIDPVVIFKMVLIQHLYGLPSLRRTVEEIKMNVAYRWFLGYLMNEQIPHFSTVSYNFKHRYTEKTIEEIFYWILNEIETAGYLSPEAVFVDGTHIKANANLKKAVKKAVPQAAKTYEKQLMEEINEERNDHGKKPFDGPKPPEEKEITESTTDPESGVFHKGEHKKCFAYTAQTGCDKNGYVMDVTVNPGNMHDSVAFDGLYDRLAEKNPEIKAVVADAGYKTPWISKRILDDGRIPVLPYKRPMSKKGFFPPYEYVYDEYFNCVICPENQVLSYATTNREGYREFKSKGYICENCPSRHLCTENRKFEKTVTKHIWSDYLETVEDIRHTPEYKALYERRKETIERVFADAKEKYAMRYTPYRGLSQVTNWVRLKFAAMNLKKYALHRWKRSHQYSALIRLYTFFAKTKLITLNLA